MTNLDSVTSSLAPWTRPPADEPPPAAQPERTQLVAVPVMRVDDDFKEACRWEERSYRSAMRPATHAVEDVGRSSSVHA